MDLDEALALLGVDDATPFEEVRRHYLALIRRHHPDVATHVAVARGRQAIDAAEITEAYRVVRDRERDARASPPSHRLRPHISVTVDGDTIAVGLPPDETFFELLDLLSNVGAVTYVDPEGGLVEVLLDLANGVRCSLVASLQGRAATASTDVFLTVHPGVDLTQLAVEVAQLLAGSLNS